MRLTPWLLGPLSFTASAIAGQPCRIEVVEQGDAWPVPGVELRTVHGVRLVSDNAGLIACDLPELMGRETWFTVIGHGYGVKADGFGYHGVRLTPIPGKTLKVIVERTILARRLGRLTGAGLFAESQKLGELPDWKESGVLGSDSVVTAELGGKLLWFWGDTNLPHHPLGIFNVSAASTEKFVPPAKPPLRPPYAYVNERKTAQGETRPRGVAAIPGEGPTWVWGAVTLPDAQGAPHLVASAVKVKGEMHAYRWDLVEWDPHEELFRPLDTVWTEDAANPKAPPLPDGHAVPWSDQAGRNWILFCNPFPSLRTPATYEGWKNPETWKPLRPAAAAATPAGENIFVHGGHVAWHPWSRKWLAIFTQKAGKPSFLGEVWLAEAAEPFGPWVNARKVLSHDDYTFYNPVLHPEFFRADSPVVHFEGTYTTTFSGNKQPTPRWDYNQVLYQLDLSQPPFSAGK
jgi:hypothetical protein